MTPFSDVYCGILVNVVRRTLVKLPECITTCRKMWALVVVYCVCIWTGFVTVLGVMSETLK